MSLALVLARVGAALPSQYALPGDDVFPEGIALRPGHRPVLRLLDRGPGTIYRGTLGKPRTEGLPARRARTGARSPTACAPPRPPGRGRQRDRATSSSTTSAAAGSCAASRPVGRADQRRGDRARRRRLRDRLHARAAVPHPAPRRSPSAARATTRLRPFVRVARHADRAVTANGHRRRPGERYLLVVGLASGVLGRVDLEDQAGEGGQGRARCPRATGWPATAARSTRSTRAAG